jgi:site-specific DNA-methyltransferase (adenine-specific)
VSLADKSIDHVITDPPYEAEAHTLQRRAVRATGIHDGGAFDNGGGVCQVEPLSFEPLSFEVRSGVAREAGRLARRWVVAFGQVEAAMTWRDALVAAGLRYRRTGVWVKPDGMPQYSGDRPGMGYESLVICHAPGRSSWNGGGKHGVWTFNKNDFPRTGHETQKPLPLMLALVADFTDPGELVCDPFAGSGTTGVACIRLGRRFVGWERDPKYFAVAVKRLRAAREQLRMTLPVEPTGEQGALLPASPFTPRGEPSRRGSTGEGP